MPKSPAFQFYPRDYLADPIVVCMTLEEQGAYVRLLCHAWDPPCWAGKDKPPVGCLPNEPELLAAIAGFGTLVRWDEHSDAILRAFKVSDDGSLLIQKRLVEEYAKQEQHRIARSNAGKHSGKSRRTKSNKCSNVFEQNANKKRTKSNSASASASADQDPPIAPQEGGDGSDSLKGRKVKATRRPVDPASLSEDEDRLVSFWREQCDRPRSALEQLDLDRLREALRDADLAGEYEVTTVRLAGLAIRGCALSDFHMGREPGHPAKRTDLALIFRDRKHIRQFVDIATAAKGGKPTGRESFAAQRQREIDARQTERPELVNHAPPPGEIEELRRKAREAREAAARAQEVKP